MNTHTACVGPDGHFWESHGEPIWTRIPRLPGETDMAGMARILGEPEDRIARVYFSIPMYWVKDADDDLRFPLRELQSGDVESIAVNTRWTIPRSKI